MNAIEKIHFNFNFLPIILVTSCSEPKKTKYNYAAGEFEIIINPGDWELSGTLFLPEGEGPFPVVILLMVQDQQTEMKQLAIKSFLWIWLMILLN